MIADLQVLPDPVGEGDDKYKHVNAAIAVIAASGIKHTVNALGTVMEGEPDEVWPVLRAAFEACLKSGAKKELCFIKLYQGEATVDDLQTSGRACSEANLPGGTPKKEKFFF